MNDNLKITKCDFCDKDSIGYVSRQLQGPFYCADHEAEAEMRTDIIYAEIERTENER